MRVQSRMSGTFSGKKPLNKSQNHASSPRWATNFRLDVQPAPVNFCFSSICRLFSPPLLLFCILSSSAKTFNLSRIYVRGPSREMGECLRNRWGLTVLCCQSRNPFRPMRYCLIIFILLSFPLFPLRAPVEHSHAKIVGSDGEFRARNQAEEQWERLRRQGGRNKCLD